MLNIRSCQQAVCNSLHLAESNYTGAPVFAGGYGWVDQYNIVDVGIDLSHSNRSSDVILLVKNAVDELARNHGFITGAIGWRSKPDSFFW